MGKIRVFDDSYIAASDMRTKQYQPVKLTTTADTVDVCAAATDVVYGILQDKPNTGDRAQVATIGRYSALVDGSGTAIAIGDLLGPGSDGTKLVKKATADYNVCARALEPCTIATGVIDVFLFAGIGAVFRTLAG